MDEWLINMINGSVMTLGAINILIKAISRISPWSWDNAISDALDEILGMLFPRGGGNKNKSV